MPKKINRAGQLQNYVPAGSGDASGEYGDKLTGSNKNIKIEKVESKTLESKVESGGIKESANTGINDKENKSKIKNYIAEHSKFKKETLKIIDDIVENGEEKCNEVLSRALDKNEYTFKKSRTSYYRNGAKEISLSSSDLGSLYRETGESFYHEVGHLIDSQNKNSYQAKPISAEYVSKVYGTTLNDMVKEEGKAFSLNREEIRTIKRAEAELVVQSLESVGITQEMVNSYREKQEQFLNQTKKATKVYDDKKSDALTDFYSGKILFEEYKKIETESKIEKQKALKEFNEINKSTIEDINNFNTKLYEAKRKGIKEYVLRYGSLSDMYEAATGGSYDLGAGGHGKAYWKRSPELQGMEFFAEIYSAKATKSKQYEIMKKYFPKSVEIFEEVLKEI